MATGTVKWFAQALTDLGNKVMDMDGDTIKLGLVTSATVPAVNTAAPCWGAGGTTNFSTNQVSTGGTSYTGPVTLGSKTWTNGATGPVFDAADPSTWAQDGSGPTNIAYGIIYDDTAANKQCIGWVEISSAGTCSLVAGPLTITWNASGILAIAQS